MNEKMYLFIVVVCFFVRFRVLAELKTEISFSFRKWRKKNMSEWVLVGGCVWNFEN